MRHLISKYFAYWYQDITNKTKILKTYKFLLKSQNWGEKEIEAYKLEKLKKIITHAYNNVPFYTELFNKNGIRPSDINSENDLEKIPIITKDDVRNAGESIYSTDYKTRMHRLGKTGGTTGVPLHLIKDSTDLSFTWGAFFRWQDWIGAGYWTKTAKIWGTNKVLSESRMSKFYDRIKDVFHNRVIINSFDINERTLPIIIRKLNKTKPKFIRGYLSALIQIAEYMNENKIELCFKPVAVSPTTETLLPPFRKLLEQTFKAPVYDQYGCGECNSMAFECEAHMGLHIVDEHVIVQINKDGKSVEDQNGNIILTNLDNYAMPLIRYENGDSAILSSKQCSCARHSKILKQINGRSTDTITTKDGNKVHGVFFTDILDELFAKENIVFKRFQVIQTIPGNIIFKVETKKKLNEYFRNEILTSLQRFFNEVELIEAMQLESDLSGKFRYVVSKL